MKRSQYSMEFLIFFAILTLLFIVWLIVYVNLHQDAYTERDKKAIMDLGKSIQANIFAASNVRSGFFSDNLLIPKKVGMISFELNNTEYVFYITTKGGEYIFHIPYTMGYLEKGKNRLWNVNGVVAIGDFPPRVNESGHVIWSRCNDRIDNDGDGMAGIELKDIEDGACWRNYKDPYYDGSRDNETAINPNLLGTPGYMDYVYNYYILCKSAQNESFCHLLESFGLPVSDEDCCDYTYEEFCCS